MHTQPVVTESERRKALLARLGTGLPFMDNGRVLSPGAAWFSLGDTLVREARLEAALAAFDESDALAPGNPRVLQARAYVLSKLRRYRAATEALQGLPRTASRLAMEADLALSDSRTTDALRLCDEALVLDARHYEARLNRGAALRSLGRLVEALDNDQQLVIDHPGQALAHYNLGDAQLANGQYAAALHSFTQSQQLNPRHTRTRMGRTIALTMLCRFDAAETLLAETRALDLEGTKDYLLQAALAIGFSGDALFDVPVREIYLSQAMVRQRVCEWPERAGVKALLPTFTQALAESGSAESGLAFDSLLFDIDPAMQRSLAAATARRAECSAKGFALRRFWSERPPVPRAGRRLRIGFLSPDFRAHPVGDSHWRQFALHDRSRFEVVAYSLFDAGPSQALERIRAACDEFVDLSRLLSEAAAQRIAAEGIDILVDLSGYTQHTRPEILAARPAPLQLQHMGTPGSSGARFIDYRLTDRLVSPPEHEGEWPEKFAWLPHTLWLADDTQVIGPTPTRSDCGLPDDGFVFCCFNTHQKLEPESFTCWMRLLAGVTGSVLWLAEGSEASRRNLCAAAFSQGIEPTRLVFAPRMALPEHTARHACADLFLDTFVYNAGVTALIALWSGLPVLTRLGQAMASRMGASAVLAFGFPELVAADTADYEARALHLATHPEEVAALRTRVAAARATSPLFRTEERVRHIERAYEMMWDRHCRGEAPASFAIAE